MAPQDLSSPLAPKANGVNGVNGDHHEDHHDKLPVLTVQPPIDFKVTLSRRICASFCDSLEAFINFWLPAKKASGRYFLTGNYGPVEEAGLCSDLDVTGTIPVTRQRRASAFILFPSCVFGLISDFSSFRHV